MYIYIYIYIHMCVCVYINIHLYDYIYIYIYTHIHYDYHYDDYRFTCAFLRKSDCFHHHRHHHHHHPEGVVCRGFCFNSGTVAVSEIVFRRWWCIESLFPLLFSRSDCAVFAHSCSIRLAGHRCCRTRARPQASISSALFAPNRH